MKRRFFIAWVLMFFLWMVGSFVVHGLLLGTDYAQLTTLFRNEADSQQHFQFMLAAHVIMAGAFVWIYARGAQEKPWLPQGMRFGVAVALMTVVPTYLIYYAVQPMPGALVGKQIVFDGLLIILLGMAVAFMYRKPAVA